jgi:hypothetical protein
MHSTHHRLFPFVSSSSWQIRPVAAMVVVKTLVLIKKG